MENLQQVRRTRSGKLLGTVVTKKVVVRETVEVVVTPYDSSKENNNNNNNQVELQVISTSTKENEKVEVISSTPGKSPLRKINIVFGEETEDQVMKEAPEERDEEEERRKKEQWRKEEHANEIEKQQTRDYIQNSENQHAVDQPEKNGMDMEDEDETQPASEPDIPPPPPLEKEMLQEDNDVWFDVEYEEQKEPFPLEPEADEEEEEEERETEKAKQAEEGHELSTPPRYEVPPKKEEGTDKKKRKASPGARKGRGRKRPRRRGGDIAADYKTYIYRVLKQVHPDLGISSRGMATINSFLNEMYEKIADEAGKLSRYTGGKTLSVRDIQDSVKMVLPGDLGKHAMAEGAKAVSRYATHTHKALVDFGHTPNVRSRN